VTEAELLIRNQPGLHARLASLFVKTAAKFRSHILVSHDDLEVNGKSIMGLLELAAEEGATIRVRADGPDEREAVNALQQLVSNKFGVEP
jgi:phosphocarrier protein